jgi:hypothetical protein
MKAPFGRRNSGGTNRPRLQNQGEHESPLTAAKTMTLAGFRLFSRCTVALEKHQFADSRHKQLIFSFTVR